MEHGEECAGDDQDDRQHDEEKPPGDPPDRAQDRRGGSGLARQPYLTVEVPVTASGKVATTA
jgi:hypothetical protein